MPSVNQVSNLLPSGGQGVEIPLDVKQRMLAEQLAQETAAAPKGPYTSKTAGLVSALTGGLGGLMQGIDAQRVMQGNRNANAEAMAYLDAAQRQRMNGVSQAGGSIGSSGGAPAGGIGSDHVAGTNDYLSRVAQVENGGRDGGNPSAAGAVGRYQFTAPTWANLERQHPELGLTPDGRTDPAQQQRAIQVFSNQNASALGQAGFQATPGNMYLAHFAGAGGATAALKADPSTPVEQVLGPQAVAANPFLRGKTAGDLVGWANGKMSGVDPASVPGSAVPNASSGLQASADMPAPNAQPVASNTLPPGITPDMLGPDASVRDHLMAAAAAQGGPSPQPAGSSSVPPAAAPTPPPAPSPTDPSQPDPSLRDTILAAAAPHPAPTPPPPAPTPDPGQGGDDLRATIMAAAAQQQQPDPDAPAPGAVPTAGAGLPPGITADMIGGGQTPPATPPAPDPSLDPEGTGSANYDLSTAPSLRDTMNAAMQPQPGAGVPGAASASGSAPASADGSPYGAMPTSMDQVPASVAGSNMAGVSNLSPAGKAMSAMGPNGVDPSFLSPSSASGMATSLSAAPLSTDNLPGMDSFNAAGGVQQSSLGASGFTGRDNASDPITASTQGGLPAPQSYVGGDLGLGTPSTTSTPAADAQIQPRTAALVAGLSQPTPSASSLSDPKMLAAAMMKPTPGTGAALPETGPMPPARPAGIGDDPDAPAPGAIPTSAPGLPTSALQSLGTAGHGGGDPMSAQSFNRQQALLQGLQGGAPQSPAPTALQLAQGMMSQGAPADAQNGAQGSPAAQPSSGGFFGGGGILSKLFGGGQQPAPQSVSASAGGGQAPAGGQGDARSLGMQVLNDPYASPEMKSMVMQRMFPQTSVEKTEDGKIVAVNPQDLTSRVIYDGSPKADWTPTADGTRMINKTTAEVRPMPGYGNGSGGWRSMTSAERTQFGVTDGRPAYMAPNGEPHFGMPETQGQGESAEAKTAGEGAATRRGEMLAAADAAPEKIARLKLLGTVLDNTQTGPLAEEVGNAASIAQRLGISNDRLKELGVDPNQPVNNAVANKLAGEMTMSSIGAKNGGMPASNFSVAERQFIEALYPNIENQAGGNRAVTDVLTAMEQRKLQMADGWASYKDAQRQAGKPLSYEDYEDQFRQAHAQDNIFTPIIQKYQAGGYTPTVPTAGGQGGAASPVAGSGTPGTASAATPGGGGQPTSIPGASAPATAAAAPATPAAAPQAQAPVPGARQAPDGNWYVSDPARPGKYLMVK